MRRRVGTVVALAVVMVLGGGGSSPAAEGCYQRCAEKKDGKCVRLENICVNRNEGDADSSGSDNKGYVTTRKCYECTQWHTNGTCLKTKVVPC